MITVRYKEHVRHAVKRRKLLIDPQFQYRFVKKVTMLVLLVVTSSMAGVLMVISWIKRKVAQPDPFSDHAAVSFASMPDVSWMVVNLWPYFLLGLLLVTVLSMAFGVLESFRIAGPEHRMRQVLTAMAEGDFRGKPILLRKHDELEKLYQGIIAVHAAWKGRVQSMQNICDKDSTADVRLGEVKEMLSHFKTGKGV